MSSITILNCPKCGFSFTARVGMPHWISEDHPFHPKIVKKEIQSGAYGPEIKKVLEALPNCDFKVEEAVFQCHICKKIEIKRHIILHGEFGTYSNKQYNCSCGAKMHLKSELSSLRCPDCKEKLIEVPYAIE